MPLSYDDALLELQNTPFNQKALTDLAKKVSIEATESVMIFYGNKVPDGTYASDAIAAMVKFERSSQLALVDIAQGAMELQVTGGQT